MPTDMNLTDAISGRRSIGRVKDEPIPREIIEELLEAANWAPSHRCTEPWRFFVMTGAGRGVLAEAYADVAAEGSGASGEALEELRAKQGSKAYRAPVIIGVAVSPSEDPAVNRMEEFAAAHSAVQNMLLAAHGLGLAAIWRSGDPMYHPRMKAAFGLREQDEMVALVYVGYPQIAPQAGKRNPVQEKTVWITEDSESAAE
ncbi:nitroreductase family protein [Paenibacillus chitinolyticus]|uniref:nitroreductase family protein n=1 Tax=Paenibacillus chitinolyticus TaxID=79263 RepID=UPI001C47C2D8|nr:nitroreductase [Paenibacillus chitinolyticus]MBV6713152.1 nitroreductase [Paenibacillus chitinolyticus]